MNLINPFDQPGKWYKANFHAHTTNSDGLWSPREVADHYRKNGYGVLNISDHDRTNDVAPLSGRNFLVLSGAEFAVPRVGGGEKHHLVAINIPRNFKPGSAAKNANSLIRAVRRAGGEVILAHPFWSKCRYDQFSYIENLAAMEVFNFSANDNGRGNSEADWSHLLDDERILPAAATDDSHSYPVHACGGWVWLKLRELTAKNVLQSLRTGNFYSSSGPRIDDFRLKEGRIILRCSPAAAVHMVLHKPTGGTAYVAKEGPIRSLNVQLPADWQVFRAVVIDSSGRRAWTNPIICSGRQAKREFMISLNATWKKPYRASAGRYEMLDLKPVANRPLLGKDAWIGDGSQMTQITPGVHNIHGVPFRIIDQKHNCGKSAIAVRSRTLRTTAGKPVPASVKIPVNRLCHGIYILHGAGFVLTHEKIADYIFVYKDGSKEVREVWGCGKQMTGGSRDRKMWMKSSVQDWWPAFMQFDNENARKVYVIDRKRPLDYRVLYTMQWLNPHPERILREIRVKAVTTASSALLLLAATAKI